MKLSLFACNMIICVESQKIKANKTTGTNKGL